jgi:quinol monooxygenase YgiN
MIGLVATITVQDGKGEDFEKVFAELAAKVRENEPGCFLYQLNRTSDPTVYKVMELYRDAEARTQHGQSEHFKTIGRQMGAFMAGRPQIEDLTPVGDGLFGRR